MSAAAWHGCATRLNEVLDDEPARVAWRGSVDGVQYELWRMRGTLGLKMQLPSGTWVFIKDRHRWHRVTERALLDMTA